MLDAFLQLGAAGLFGGSAGVSPLQNASGPSLLGSMQEVVTSWLKLDMRVLVVLFTLSRMMPVALPWVLSVYWWVVQFFTVSISIGPKDRLNREVINWLGANVLGGSGQRILTARSEIIESDACSYQQIFNRSVTVIEAGREKNPPIQYLPTFGTTWFFVGRRLFVIWRVDLRGKSSSPVNLSDVSNEWASAAEGDEPLLVLCLGRSVEPIKRFLSSCRVFAERQREAYVTVRACNNPDTWRDTTWDTTILQPLRALDTIHFDREAKNDLVADIEKYLQPETRRFYRRRGIPYRRGYLLHGPPGTGKTSLSYALASRFDLELYILELPSISGDSDLRMLFTRLPPRCFVLVEDIDAVGLRKRPAKRPKEGDDDDSDDSDDSEDEARRPGRGQAKVTLSGLLNVLDGVASQEGRIVLMTSNFADRLDAALVRPGRIDRSVFLGNISKKSAEGMFLRWFLRDPEPTEPVESADANHDTDIEKLAARFAAEIPDEKLSPALLQNYLQKTTYDPHQAVEGVTQWVSEELAKIAAEAEEKKRAIREKKKSKMKAMTEVAQATVLATLEVAGKLNQQGSGTPAAEGASDPNAKPGKGDEDAGLTAADANADEPPSSTVPGDGGSPTEGLE